MSQPFDQERVGVYWWRTRENGPATIKMDPKSGILDVGGQTVNGRIRVNDEHDHTICEIDVVRRVIELKDEYGNVTICLDGRTGNISFSGEMQPSVHATH